MKDLLNTLLNELNEKAEMPDHAMLYSLSNLETEEVERLCETWGCLPTALRRELITQLTKIAEKDITVNFGAVFRIGIEDTDAKVRATAIDGLWEDKDVRLVPRLSDRLQRDKAVEVRAAAATSLGRFILLGELEKIRPKPMELAYETLLSACQGQGEHMEVQRRALESLAYVGNDTIVALIEEAYEAPEEKMRISAVFAMGRSADTRWEYHVQQELFNPNPEMRYEAARSCGELQLSESVPQLEELIDDADTEVQEAALWALGQIGGDKAREILEYYSEVENEALRAAAHDALEELEFLHGDLSELFHFLMEEPEW